MIPSLNKRRRRDSEENEDKLSDLPDRVLLHILSFLNSKYAVQTCVLSKRWEHLWKRVPTLILHTDQFSTVKRFAIFVSQILKLRDRSTALQALDFVRLGIIEPQLLKKILKYINSHNTHIQQLQIYVSVDTCPILRCISSCRALTFLRLEFEPRVGRSQYTKALFPKSLNLPLLTSLYLEYFAFCGGENGCAEPFSSFTKLNSLVISNSCVKDAQILSISNETLVNLSIHYHDSSNIAKTELSTPSLSTFTFPNSLDHKICGSGLSCVKHVVIYVPSLASVDHALVLFSWLQGLANVETLKVSSTTLQILSLVPDLLDVKLPSLCNLKSLEIELIPLSGGSLFGLMEKAMLKKASAKSLEEAGLKPSPLPDGIVDFLRQNSPLAEVNITTKFRCFKLKQVDESVKGTKRIRYPLQFDALASSSASSASSSSASPASAAKSASAPTAAPASATPPNLHLCCAKEIPTDVDSGDSTLWPDWITKVFIDIMVDEVTKGNISNGVFHTTTLTSMTTRLNSVTNCSYKREQLKEKIHSLQAMFHEFYSLLQNSGFECNAETNTVIASEEAHDKASQFQKKGCSYYKLLEIIFNKNNETGVLHRSSTPDRPSTTRENEYDNQNFNTDNDIEEVECIKCRGKQKSQVKDHASGKEFTSGQIEDTHAARAHACGKNVEITSSHVKIDYSLTKCVVALEEIKDISDDIYGKALKNFKDPDWREMFIAMSKDRRRGWLLRL